MPKKASAPKKARWSSAQKAEARKGKTPKKAHHRGQPDGPRSAPKRGARVDGDGSKRPRAERSPRWDPADPRRADRNKAPRRADDRGPRSSGDSSNRSSSGGSGHSSGSRYTGERNSTGGRGDSSGSRSPRDASGNDRRDQRQVHRPHDE
ncbi:MAG: DEAD/DEAH box helicase, partial [Ornithinibacter sp.]